MITLHIAKLLEDNGFGTVALTGNETGNLIYWEKLPQGKNGIYVISTPTAIDRNSRNIQSFDIYSRGTNDLEGKLILDNIVDFFKSDGFTICDLPEVPKYSTAQYRNCSIVTTAAPNNLGQDETNRLIWSMSADIRYKKI